MHLALDSDVSNWPGVLVDDGQLCLEAKRKHYTGNRRVCGPCVVPTQHSKISAAYSNLLV